MSVGINALVEQVAAHYRSRGFDGATVRALTHSLRESHHDGVLYLPGAVLRRKVEALLGRFLPLPHDAASDAELGSASAILAFAFGYRLRSDQGDVPAARLPGANNRKLAQIAADLKQRFPTVPLCAQAEIADALEDRDPPVPVDIRCPCENWGTKLVLDHFLRALGWPALQRGSGVIVVAHAHHVGRCLMLVGDVRLRGLLPSASYKDYDPGERQPRVRSPMDYIHSDFVSLVATWSEVSDGLEATGP